jgi:hypothetical protein
VPLELQHLLGAAALTGGGLGAALLAGAAAVLLVAGTISATSHILGTGNMVCL